MYWGLAALVVAAAFWVIRRWLAFRKDDTERLRVDAAAAVNNFPFAKYAAMSRLVDSDELDQLRRQRGNARMVSLLTKGRRSLVRQYLNELDGDFYQLRDAAEVFFAYHAAPPATAAVRLFAKTIVFWWRLRMARVQLWRGLPALRRVESLLAVARDVHASVAGSLF